MVRPCLFVFKKNDIIWLRNSWIFIWARSKKNIFISGFLVDIKSWDRNNATIRFLKFWGILKKRWFFNQMKSNERSSNFCSQLFPIPQKKAVRLKRALVVTKFWTVCCTNAPDRSVFWISEAGIFGRQNQSVSWNWEAGIHGPQNRSVFWNWEDSNEVSNN